MISEGYCNGNLILCQKPFDFNVFICRLTCEGEAKSVILVARCKILAIDSDDDRELLIDRK